MMGDTQASTQDNVDGENQNLNYGFRSGNLFVIDGTPAMFLDSDEAGSYFYQCLQMYERILRQKLSHNKVDWMGLILFGTTASDPETKNILTLLKFGPVTVEMLKELLDIIENKMSYYESRASEDHYPIANVLLHAGRCFDAVKIKMPNRQVNLMTCHDNPVPDDNDERHKARINAKNFKDISVNLRVVGFGENWNFELFYKELEMLATDSDTDIKRTYVTDLEDEVTRAARIVGHLDLKIKGSFVAKISLHAFAKRRQYISSIAMSKETNEPLDKYFHYTKTDDFFRDECNDDEEEDEAEMEDIRDSSIRKSKRYGGRDIMFTTSEYKYLRRLKAKGIEILRFERASEREPEYHIQVVLFLGIHSDAPKGQKEFLATLLSKCQEKNLVAICAATPRENLSTSLFRMIPCPKYGGFYFYQIPFADELSTNMEHLFERYNYNTTDFPVNKEKLDITEKIVKKFRILYTPSIFPNPAQRKLTEYIQSLALDEPYDAGAFEDYTKPAAEILGQKLASKGLIQQFFDVFPNLDLPMESQAKKMLKIDKDAAKELLLNSKLSSLTVVQLRAILKAFDLNTSGVKTDLVCRLEDYKKSVI